LVRFGFRRRGRCGLRLKRLSALADFSQALLFIGDPIGHLVAATGRAVEFVLLRVGCLRSFKPAIHFGAKLRLTRLHAFVAQRRHPEGLRSQYEEPCGDCDCTWNETLLLSGMLEINQDAPGKLPELSVRRATSRPASTRCFALS
jgi:hypothetical protein